MTAYYNELDPFAAAWLRELIKADLIAPGDVDERSIQDVTAHDVRGYTQAHFFAGIGGWSYALRLAGWPDDRAVWTGSCPCQPFSSAGKGAGADDPRDLWPAWFKLVAECRPGVVFGEQVASADGLGWFDRVSTDLEGTGYAVGAVDLCAASVGAFHIRQRLWFLADAEYTERRTINVDREDGRHGTNGGRAEAHGELGTRGEVYKLGDAELSRPFTVWQPSTTENKGRMRQPEGSNFWSDAIWIPCRNGKCRPAQPAIFPLAARVPGRVGLLRGAGNSIVPQCAQAFIESYLDLTA